MAGERLPMMRRVSAIVDALWLGGTALSAGGLAYGAFLVYDFHCRATEAALRAIARLALHDSARPLLEDGERAARR